MDEADRNLLVDAVDAWVSRYHKVDGYRSWGDSLWKTNQEPEMVYPHAGWDAEAFCTSPEGEAVLRRIFGSPRAES